MNYAWRSTLHNHLQWKCLIWMLRMWIPRSELCTNVVPWYFIASNIDLERAEVDKQTSEEFFFFVHWFTLMDGLVITKHCSRLCWIFLWPPFVCLVVFKWSHQFVINALCCQSEKIMIVSQFLRSKSHSIIRIFTIYYYILANLMYINHILIFRVSTFRFA